jgi:hypothetical protein
MYFSGLFHVGMKSLLVQIPFLPALSPVAAQKGKNVQGAGNYFRPRRLLLMLSELTGIPEKSKIIPNPASSAGRRKRLPTAAEGGCSPESRQLPTRPLFVPDRTEG